MKLRIAIAVIILGVGLSACVSPLLFAVQKRVPLAYVGAVSFGTPVTKGSHITIPLIIDYRSGEWAMNSAKAAYGTTSRVSGREIEFSVFTSLASSEAKAGLELRLPMLAAGDYTISYRDPDGTAHALGPIKIKQ